MCNKQMIKRLLNNRPIVDPDVPKEALWAALRLSLRVCIKIISFIKRLDFEIRLLQCYEVLWIHNHNIDVNFSSCNTRHDFWKKRCNILSSLLFFCLVTSWHDGASCIVFIQFILMILLPYCQAQSYLNANIVVCWFRRLCVDCQMIMHGFT